MKTLVLLLLTTIASAQVQFVDKEYFTTSVALDPTASVKEKSINACVELELVSYWKYVKLNVQMFPALKGTYTDFTGGFGLNLTSDIFNTFRYYAGGRFGLIKREQYIYPLVGIEGGIDYNITDSMFIGLRTTGDYREDFIYSGADPKMIYSGFVRVGFTF